MEKFVYEPHFAPQFEAWAQSYVDRRRRERARRQGPIGVPVSPTDDPDENAGRRSPNRTRRGHSDSSDEDDDSPAIEMASLLSRDENLRRSSNPGRSDLRRRTRATGPIDEVSISHCPSYVLIHNFC